MLKKIHVLKKGEVTRYIFYDISDSHGSWYENELSGI
jgi:hypothetical protein